MEVGKAVNSVAPNHGFANQILDNSEQYSTSTEGQNSIINEEMSKINNTFYHSDLNNKIARVKTPDNKDESDVQYSTYSRSSLIKELQEEVNMIIQGCNIQVPHDGTKELSDNSCESQPSSSMPCVENKLDVSGISEYSENEVRMRLRTIKRKKESDECCPVCGVTVRMPELESHFAQEVERLTKISKNLKKPRHEACTLNMRFEQVKHNRENRVTAKVAKYRAKLKDDNTQCPVCNLKMTWTQDEIQQHVFQCLKEHDATDDEDIVVDDDESFEEYEFGDETRIRPISLVPGGYRALNGGSSSNNKATEDDEELNVDEDESAYGQPQYTELDVIPSTHDSDTDESSEELRKAVLQKCTAEPRVLTDRKWSNNGDEQPENAQQTCSMPDPVVSSLKDKIKDLEEEHNKSVKCLICMESYTKPVVSTTCWHVYCEECWLMAMGRKKLCPQCNMIVFPSDLRRIFL